MFSTVLSLFPPIIIVYFRLRPWHEFKPNSRMHKAEHCPPAHLPRRYRGTSSNKSSLLVFDVWASACSRKCMLTWIECWRSAFCFCWCKAEALGGSQPIAATKVLRYCYAALRNVDYSSYEVDATEGQFMFWFLATSVVYCLHSRISRKCVK